MEEILTPSTIKLEKEEGNEAVFVIEPCFPGYGHTLGNALRRVLLSSLSGGAVTAVRIKGVSHEFEAVEHVKEDMVEIILNLKKLNIDVHGEDPVILTLNKKGAGVVTAGDFDSNSQVEISNKDLELLTTTSKDANIEMEVVVEHGMGYLPVEQRDAKSMDVGMILVDAAFSPITRVSYDVENMRVGQRTDYDRLRITIETDGTMTPRESLTKSASILVSHFEFITGADKAKKEEEIVKEEEPKKEVEEEGDLAKIVQELNLSTRTSNALDKAKIRTIGDLVSYSSAELLALEGFGETALKEIQSSLKKLDITLKEDK